MYSDGARKVGLQCHITVQGVPTPAQCVEITSLTDSRVVACRYFGALPNTLVIKRVILGLLHTPVFDCMTRTTSLVQEYNIKTVGT